MLVCWQTRTNHESGLTEVTNNSGELTAQAGRTKTGGSSSFADLLFQSSIKHML